MRKSWSVERPTAFSRPTIPWRDTLWSWAFLCFLKSMPWNPHSFAKLSPGGASFAFGIFSGAGSLFHQFGHHLDTWHPWHRVACPRRWNLACLSFCHKFSSSVGSFLSPSAFLGASQHSSWGPSLVIILTFLTPAGKVPSEKSAWISKQQLTWRFWMVYSSHPTIVTPSTRAVSYLFRNFAVRGALGWRFRA